MGSLWTTLAVSDIDEAVEFYQNKLGFSVDFTVPNEDGNIFFASVELGESNIMFDLQQPLEIDDSVRRKIRADMPITLLLPDSMDIDTFFAQVKGNDVEVIANIGDRYWGNREFAIRDLNGYCIVFASFKNEVGFDDLKELAQAQN